MLLGSLLIAAAVSAAPAAAQSIAQQVREAVRANDLARAKRTLEGYRAQHGVSPEMLEALSWLGRGELAAKQYDSAEQYAAETHKLVLDLLKKRKLDEDRSLPLALGASIEVQGQVMAARGERSQAVAFLQQELKRWRDTSIRTRIQKNIHLLSLEGKRAPAIEGVKAPAGKPTLLFFWAHWCGDCKYQAPILARIQREYGPKGLTLIGPTQMYGYVARGEDAPPQQEAKYIEQIRRDRYGALQMETPLNTKNFKNYGASTTPTLVLIDRHGIVRLYHPGILTYDELAPKVAALLGPS